MYLSPGLLVWLVGIVLGYLGIWLFRIPGAKRAPTWRPGEYVTLPGTLMWAAGVVLAFVGFVLHVLRVGV